VADCSDEKGIEPMIEHARCACGAIRLRITSAPKEVNLCHCLTCRRIHGAPFAVYAIFERSAVSIEGDTSAWPSSEHGKRHHCPTCGSPIWLAFEGIDEIEVPTGLFGQPGLFPPEYEIWCRHAEPWHDAQGRPCYPEARPD
jgi:hypothetical protein